MTSSQPSKAQANLQLAIWDKQAESSTSEELYVRIQKLGLPEEVVSRLHDLILKVQQVSGKVIHIGKIILLKLLEFVEEHFFLVAGAGIGAVFGAALSGMITSMAVALPMIASILMPIATVLGLTVTALGAVIGNDLDQFIPSFGKKLVDIAKAFFQLFSSILIAVFGGQDSVVSFA